MHTCTHTCTRMTYTRTTMLVCTDTLAYSHLYMYTPHILIYLNAHAHTRTQPRIYIPTYLTLVYTRTYTIYVAPPYIHTVTLMNTHTPTYTHAHICTHIPHSFTCLCTHMRAHAHNTHLGSYVHGCPASRVMYCCHRSVTLWKESWKYN